jgi:hypothetical protein
MPFRRRREADATEKGKQSRQKSEAITELSRAELKPGKKNQQSDNMKRQEIQG